MDTSSTPLAEYFWIAGIENISYDDGPQTAAPQFDDTIAEDGEPEVANSSIASSSKTPARHSRQNSGNRLSKLSSEGRFQDDLDGGTRSNRSSTTIKANNPAANGASKRNSAATDTFVPDFDFDKALIKFAVERENFLDDLTFSAGAKIQSRPPMVNNPRTERVKAEDGDPSGRKSPLMRSIRGSIRGSIRRKMSFRDMNSVRRQPTAPKPGGCPQPDGYTHPRIPVTTPHHLSVSPFFYHHSQVPCFSPSACLL